MLTKSFKFSLKASGDAGEFEGYASTFGNEDLGGDIVVQGAFAKTIAENPTVPVLWGHDPREVIGISREMREDGKGLFVRGEFVLDVARAKEVYALAKQGAVRGLSIGYDAVKVDYAKDGDKYLRYLKEVKLYEYSFTPIPMNQLATVNDVKTFDALLTEIKAGRAISAANRARLERIVEEVSALLAADEQEAAEEAAKAQGEPPVALVEQLKSILEISTWN